MKVLFVCRSFDQMAGGVERQAINLMNEMVRRGHAIHLLTWDGDGAQPFYPMDDAVAWTRMGIGNAQNRASWGERFARLNIIRKTVKSTKPDVIIAFQYGCFITTRVACVGLCIPMIQAERNSVSLMNFTSAKKRRNRIFQSMRLASLITVQCPGYVNDYPTYLRHKIRVIPNPVTPATRFASPCVGKERILLSIGRLSYQKNMGVLIRAFAAIVSDFPDWKLVIAGDGEEREGLTDLIQSLGLSKRVSLLGAVKDVTSLYISSHLLCLPSRWEGFPNVIAESLAHGLPCVAFAGCAGMADLITHGKTGLLASGNENVESLAITLAWLMLDDSARGAMGIKAIESVKRYEPDKIYDMWENLFHELSVS